MCFKFIEAFLVTDRDNPNLAIKATREKEIVGKKSQRRYRAYLMVNFKMKWCLFREIVIKKGPDPH
ncbi:MAG: hypothetical protein CVU57_23535 [Deltaproteobacteria bacterium HGW-Deltaproteobacteria-15]|nr:MAG: hypothetical protein CVU57_23535 [Deltaproteobacteria bacterium HGW-Deltaproteobacteria-15]